MKDIDLKEILSKAKEMQDQFQEMQKNFANKEIHGAAGINDTNQIFVQATIDGSRKVKSIHIGQGALKQDVNVLTDLIIGAINNATDKLNLSMQTEMQKIYTPPSNMLEEKESSTDSDNT